jgi:hypothetical protein
MEMSGNAISEISVGRMRPSKSVPPVSSISTCSPPAAIGRSDLRERIGN